MSTDVMRAPGGYRPVVQFSVHADNKVGRLNEIISLLAVHEVHIMALSILDNNNSNNNHNTAQ